jgi:signal transduction histidine kinase
MHMLRMFGKRDSSLQGRFIGRVLLPPFLVLLVLGGLGFWQLDRLLRDQAIENLSSAAEATSIRLEREIFIVKSKYQADIKKLQKDRAECRKHYEAEFTFSGSPGGVCDSFSVNLASSRPSLALIEDTYVNKAKELQANQRQNINQRLSAYKQFFPETLAVMILDDKQVVSSALSGAFEGSNEPFIADAKAARTAPVNGKVIQLEKFELAVFAFPIAKGSVLAAYDVNNKNYINSSWESSPINKDQSLVVILDSLGQVVYPELRDGAELSNPKIRDKGYSEIKLAGVRNIAVGKEVAGSNWLVVVTSPKAAVLSPIRDAQLVSAIIIGLLIVGFLWVGTFFIQRTVNNIIQLVTGAMVFGSGRLDYKLNLSHAEKEFKQLAETMNYMARRISDTEREIDMKNKEFISIATHELRTPMTAIIGYLSLFKEKHDKKLDKDSKKYLEEAYYGTVRLRDLINDMLDVARLEGGKVEFNLAPQNFEKIIDEIIDTQTTIANMSNIKLSYDSSQAAMVLADEGRLRIVINNLVSNAIKYNRPGGFVKVSHERKDGQLITVVKDNGLGIPAEQKNQIFEKFFRVKNSDRNTITGTGLGMHITKRYVQEMNGKIWFDSTHGQGSTFYVSLPIGHKGDEQHKQVASDNNQSPWIMRWRKRLK